MRILGRFIFSTGLIAVVLATGCVSAPSPVTVTPAPVPTENPAPTLNEPPSPAQDTPVTVTTPTPKLKVVVFQQTIESEPALNLRVPEGYKVIGGGANAGNNRLLVESYPSDDRTWMARAATVDKSYSGPARLDVYVLALEDSADAWDVVRSSNGRLQAGYALTGGGARQIGNPADKALTASYPSGSVAWAVRGVNLSTGAAVLVADTPKTEGEWYVSIAIGIKPKNGTPAPSIRITIADTNAGTAPSGNMDIADVGYGFVGGGALAIPSTGGKPTLLTSSLVNTATLKGWQASGFVYGNVINTGGGAPSSADKSWLRVYAIGMVGLGPLPPILRVAP